MRFDFAGEAFGTSGTAAAEAGPEAGVCKVGDVQEAAWLLSVEVPVVGDVPVWGSGGMAAAEDEVPASEADTVTDTGGKAGIVPSVAVEVPVEEGSGGKAGIVPDPAGTAAEAETEAWESAGEAGGKGGRS